MLLRIDKCGDCPLIFFTETSVYCVHPKNWNEEGLDYTLRVEENLDMNSMHSKCPLREEHLTLRIK